MKKRIVAVALAVCLMCMAVLITGCQGETTFAVVSKALENTQNLESIAAKMEMQMDMAMTGMTLSIPITADIKASGLKTDDPKASTMLTMTMVEQAVEMEMYQEGSWVYIVMEDMKYKTDISSAENEYDYTDDVNNMLQEIPEELLEDVELVKNEDGSKTVSLTISDDMFAEIYDDFINDVNESAGVAASDVAISDAVVKITVADQYVSVYDMEFTMTMTVEGLETTTQVKAAVTYTDPGKEVTVTPPEGYKEFEELSLTA